MKYCNRQFSDVWEMDAAISQAWNAMVHEDDIVLHLGDVTLLSRPSKNPELAELIRGLKGRKVLTRGNHDCSGMIKAYKEWGWIVVPRIEAGDMLFTHVPPQPKPVSLVIHGHNHGQFKMQLHLDGFIDIGVDSVPGYAPIDLSCLITPEQYLAINKKLAEILAQK
jgi:calcineurin-like phosphoesterase family protein